MSALLKQIGGTQAGVAKDLAVKLPCRPPLQRAFGDDLSKDKTPLPKMIRYHRPAAQHQEKPVKLLKPLNPNGVFFFQNHMPQTGYHFLTE
ncbi:MAG: hypothetical protein M2R45_05113 [Verrucomicrobia subdivision 3 bacterium]|nr:hypothetical protein [Limisphaerales bacterium]MCS1417175.1 hypothetical protein [Limisphaerales bacterium]